MPTKPASVGEMTCKVYSLADLGNDESLRKWVVETIPEVVQPESWSNKGEGKEKLKYHGATKLMVVYHTPAVHAQVADFLQSVRKTLPVDTARGNARTANDPQVMQAQFQTPAGPPTAPPPPQQYQASYPVPFPPAVPKHLFHFIIRYEGQGIIDDNVVKFTKALGKLNSSSGTTTYAPPVPVPAPPPGNFSGPSTLPTPASTNGLTTSNSPVPAPSNVPPMPPADGPSQPPAPPPASNSAPPPSLPPASLPQ
jgi:hypothetical protein